MIHVGSLQITTIHVGSLPVPRIDWGNDKVWPDSSTAPVVVTYDIVNAGLSYKLADLCDARIVL